MLRDGHVNIITDAGGSIPLYYGHGPEGFGVGTLVHHVAAATGLDNLDKVSVVDYLFNKTVCYPFSCYKDVRVVPPGSVCSVDTQELKAHTYWEPVEPKDMYNRGDDDAAEWGNKLRRQVSSVIESSTSEAESGRVLYSGGSDSRAVLSMVPGSFECTPSIVLDQKNRDYSLAKWSSRLLGRDLDWVERPEGYYRSRLKQRIDRIGPGKDFQDMHIFGPVADRLDDVDVIMGVFIRYAVSVKLYDQCSSV